MRVAALLLCLLAGCPPPRQPGIDISGQLIAPGEMMIAENLAMKLGVQPEQVETISLVRTADGFRWRITGVPLNPPDGDGITIRHGGVTIHQ